MLASGVMAKSRGGIGVADEKGTTHLCVSFLSFLQPRWVMLFLTVARDESEVRRLEKRGGYKSFFYGNFSKDRTRWETVPATPRYGIHYVGLRNRMAILSESYSYAPYRDRILATRDFVRSILEYAAENKDAIRTLLRDARDATVRAGKAAKAADQVPLQLKAVPQGGPLNLLGFVEVEQGGRHVTTDRARNYRVQHYGRCEPTLSVSRPYSYLFPATRKKVVDNLQSHGIEVEELREDMKLDLEVYRTEKITRAPNPFQKHRLVSVKTTTRRETRGVKAGTMMVRTGQPHGTLAVYLLEPQSEDGLCTWNFFDEDLTEGQDYPVLRVPGAVEIASGRVRPTRD